MIVGEAPGANEERQLRPFVGASGVELDKMLHEAGLMRASAFVTNVCRVRPAENDIAAFVSRGKRCPAPEWTKLGDSLWAHPVVHEGYKLLLSELAMVKPRVVIALGNLALYALTGKWGITDWRGSRLPAIVGGEAVPVIPTYHPAAILRQWSWRTIAVADLRRAKRLLEGPLPLAQGAKAFIIAPSYADATRALGALLSRLEGARVRLSFDLETRLGHIACAGLAWSRTDAICIPLLKVEAPYFYWPPEIEADLIYLLYKVLTHRNAEVVGQNLLYDCQYTWRHWHWIPRVVRDTMIRHHATFAGLPKALDFICSLYNDDYVFWKNDSKDWDPKVGEKQLWAYNCDDCVNTYEADEHIEDAIKKVGIKPHADFQQSLFEPVLRMMHRGVRIDKVERDRLRMKLMEEQLDRYNALRYICGHDLNPNSPKQLKTFFYDDLRLPPIKHPATGEVTTNAAALVELSKREPLIRPVVKLLLELRSLGVFLSTFIEARLDVDGRMRCSFAIAKTNTYRFASSTNAFGTGMNMQTVPIEGKNKLDDPDYLDLPNIRTLFIPDPGHTFFDMDLDRADLQIVVWEADDADLKQALRMGLDMHLFNAASVWNLPIPADEMSEAHPNYPEHKKRYYARRQLAKQAVHATNYGVGDRKLAQTINISVHEASQFRAKWFAAHPGIKRWHDRTEQMMRRGYLENILGARFYLFDRPDLPEALAWQPQSTVAGVINRALVAIDSALPDVQILLQVHDSIAGQFPTYRQDYYLVEMARLARITLPYSDPLTIPVGFKISTKSWGDCKEIHVEPRDAAIASGPELRRLPLEQQSGVRLA